MSKSDAMRGNAYRYWCEIKEVRVAIRRRRRPSNLVQLDAEFVVIQKFSEWPRLKARVASEKAWCEQISQPRAARATCA
jgi:hypothetical protein